MSEKNVDKEYYYHYSPGSVIVKTNVDIHKELPGTIKVIVVYYYNGREDDSFYARDMDNYKLLTDEQVVTGKLTDWKNFEKAFLWKDKQNYLYP